MQNLDAQNLIVGNLNIDELKTKQEEFKKSNPTFEPLKCEGDKPFLGREGCITCPETHPYFNLQTLKCSKCPDGSSYVSEIKNCQKLVSVSYLSNLNAKNYLVLPDKSLDKYREELKELK